MRALGHTAYHHVGADDLEVEVTTAPALLPAAPQPARAATASWMGSRDVLTTGAQVLAAYHGYRRNRSVLWGVVWAMFAGVAPAITTGIAVAQGLGKRGQGG